MLWAVRHKLPSGAWFLFNCKRHWATLVIRAGNMMGRFLNIKEGVTQGDPLTMVAYGLGMLPLIQELQATYPRVTQLFYADDAGAVDTFAVIQRHLDDLVVQGPPWGYFPDPTKIILVVSLQNVPRVEAFFWGYSLRL